MTTIVIRGMNEVISRLDRIGDGSALKAALRAAALHVKGKIAVYPPSSEANMPTERGRWYERGYGTRWYSRGKLQGRRTSQTLGRRWTISERNQGFTQVVGNNASYGPFVHSHERQAWFHRRRGWKTDEQVIEEESDTIVEFVEAEIRKVLSR